MFTLLARLARDDAGFVVSAELVLIGSITVLTMVVGLAEVSFSVNSELGDMADAFDAVNHAMATIATGGFSTRNDSIASFGLYVEVLILVFMFVSGVSFTAQYRAFVQRRPQALLPGAAARRLTTSSCSMKCMSSTRLAYSSSLNIRGVEML